MNTNNFQQKGELISEDSLSEGNDVAKSNYILEANEAFLDFDSVKVTKIDETKPWKPALEVEVVKNNGEIEEGLDANTTFFKFIDLDNNEMLVPAAVAGHIDDLHIKSKDLGSKFDYKSLNELFTDMACKIPTNIGKEEGVSAFSINMGKNMGNEGIANINELKTEGIINDSDITAMAFVKDKVYDLNKEGTVSEKKEFIDSFNNENSSCKIQFQLIRDSILIPFVETKSRPTTELFMVFGPGEDGKKILYTAAPGRDMPKHPDINQHKDPETSEINEESFKESANAWFYTLMLKDN